MDTQLFNEENKPKSKISLILGKIEGFVLSTIMGSILLLIIVQVYFRFFTESSIVWSEELSRFLLIWMVFLGAVAALRQGAHIQIDNLVNAAPKMLKIIMLLLRNLLMLGFLFIIFIGIFPVLEVSSMQKSPGLGVSMGLVYGVFPVAIGLMILIVLWGMIKNFKGGE